jgi:hypothetical protein
MQQKQTAVEWLLERYKSQNTLLFADDFEQAKEMHKQQIIEAYKEFVDTQLPNEVYEQCYKEIFG